MNGVRVVWFRSSTDRRPLEKAADDNLLVCCSQSIRDIAIDL